MHCPMTAATMRDRRFGTATRHAVEVAITAGSDAGDIRINGYSKPRFLKDSSIFLSTSLRT
jgi:hypothetical protein